MTVHTSHIILRNEFYHIYLDAMILARKKRFLILLMKDKKKKIYFSWDNYFVGCFKNKEPKLR